MPARDRQSWQGQASRLEVGGLKGYSGIILVVPVPWGLPVAAIQGRSVRQEQVPQSNPWSRRAAALLPITEKSLGQQILLSVKMPLIRASLLHANQARAAGFEKILSLEIPGMSMETCPGTTSPAAVPPPCSHPDPQTCPQVPPESLQG